MNLYKFYWDCGRIGSVEGVFLASKGDVNSILGKEIYFGEILGKHSEIFGVIDLGDIQLITDDQDFCEKCLKFFGDKTISGHNPIDYYEAESEEEKDNEVARRKYYNLMGRFSLLGFRNVN